MGARASNFSALDCKKISMALSVRVIVISGGHKLLWPESETGVGRASTSPESILHKIVISCLLHKTLSIL